MITRMRKEIKKMSYIVWVIILGLMAPYFMGRPSNPYTDPIAHVNGRPFEVGLFRRLYQTLKMQQEIFAKQYGLKVDKNIDPVIILQEGTTSMLLDEVAEGQQFVVDRQTLSSNIKSIVSGLFGGGAIDMKLYAYHLSQLGMTIKEFEEACANDMRHALVNQAIRSSGFVPHHELVSNDNGTKKSFKILRFNKDKYVSHQEKNASYSDEELMNFYGTNRENYRLPDLKSVAYMAIDPVAYAADAVPTEEDIRKHYDDNTPSYANEDGTIKQFESIKAEIKKMLTERMQVSVLSADLQAMMKNPANPQENLEQFAKNHQLPVSYLNDLSADDADHKKSVKGAVAGAIFKQGIDRGAVVHDKKQIIYVVTDMQTNRYKQFEDIKKTVSHDLCEHYGVQIMEIDVTNAHQAFFDADKKLSELVVDAQFGHISETGLSSKKDLAKHFDKDAVVADKVFALENNLMLKKVVFANGDIGLVTLKTIEAAGQISGDVDAKRAYSSLENDLFSGLIASLKRNARIDIKNKALFATE